jgi:hypothetical protein
MLESEPSSQLNLTSRADRAEYSAYVVGEIARSILEDGISVPSQGKRSLCVTRDCEIRMIEQIVGFRAKCNLRAFRQLKGLLQRQIKLRERGAAQDIAPSIAKLTRRGQCKCRWIKPAKRSTYSSAVWTNTSVRIDPAVPKSTTTANLHCRRKALG